MNKHAGDQTVISQGVKAKGHLKSAGDLVFDGELAGHITCHGQATIGFNGRVEGNVEASSLIIKGQVNGNLTAHGPLMVEASGQINGDIKAERIKIDDGALVNGAIVMPHPVETSQTAEPKADNE